MSSATAHGGSARYAPFAAIAARIEDRGIDEIYISNSWPTRCGGLHLSAALARQDLLIEPYSQAGLNAVRDVAQTGRCLEAPDADTALRTLGFWLASLRRSGFNR
jgi:hypothetical protein